MRIFAFGVRFASPLAMALAVMSGQGLASDAPSAEQALKLTPVQADVEYERPKEADLTKCTIKAESINGQTGWVVRSPAGQVLRQFIDSNGDNVVDLWCYYSDGLEIYRDIDSNFNGKADQYRWLNMGGTRWAIDEDEDGRIDSWKRISAEETSAEAVAALAAHDSARFARLLLSDEELKELGLGGEKEKSLREKIEAAPKGFKSLAGKQKAFSAKTVWVQFGGTRPALIPTGTDGATKDLLVYENVISTVDTEGKVGQVVVGTLIAIGDKWRLIDAPEILDEAKEFVGNSQFLTPYGRTRTGGDGSGGLQEKTQQLLQQLEQLDQQAGRSKTAEAQAENAAQRCDLLEQIADSVATPEDRAQWLRNLAESISAAVQQGAMPDGIDRLKALHEKLKGEEGGQELAGYVRFRLITAQYNQDLQTQGDNFPKVQKRWLASLKQYVADYPQSADAAEAMLQLATNEEFAGEEEEAKKWYGQIVDNFPKSASAQKAAGAITRLDCVGKTLRLRGTSPSGKAVDLGSFRKKVVLLQYWATWCEPCKANMAQIKEVLAKYGKEGFTVVSISLDNRPEELVGYLRKHPLPWSHIYEPGGFDSRLANELGVLTLPTMLLLDQEGKVVNRSIDVSELDREVKALLR